MKKFLTSFDWLFLAALVLLATMGTVFIRSAGAARATAVLQSAWIVHAATAVVGLGVFFALAALDYRRILSLAALPFYVFSLLLLVAVLVFGSEIYGGRRWLWFFQPSEIAKAATILFAASWFGTPGRTRLRDLAFGFAMLGVPVLLILAEPDLGTALALVPAVLVMLLAARVCRRVLGPLLLAGLVLAGAVVGTCWYAEHVAAEEQRDRIYRALPLKPHQIKRLRVFVSPDKDPYGGGWNLRQAKISIGSGSLRGKGYGKGEQKFLGYLPPSVSMNDFIFAVLAEESGFVGSAAALALFALLAGCGLRTAFRAEDPRGRLLAVGVTTLVFTHVYVNVAMSVGLMPITGLPLPFISAGKTFLVMLCTMLGLVQSVNIHRGMEE